MTATNRNTEREAEGEAVDTLDHAAARAAKALEIADRATTRTTRTTGFGTWIGSVLRKTSGTTRQISERIAAAVLNAHDAEEILKNAVLTREDVALFVERFLTAVENTAKAVESIALSQRRQADATEKSVEVQAQVLAFERQAYAILSWLLYLAQQKGIDTTKLEAHLPQPPK